MYGLASGCFWRRRKASLSEMDGEDETNNMAGGGGKGEMPRPNTYTAKIDRPARIYPVRVYDKTGKQTDYRSGDAMEADVMLTPFTPEQWNKQEP